MKQITAFILTLIMVVGTVHFTVIPSEARAIGDIESGSFGKIFWVGENPSGDGSGASGYKIDSDAEADTALYAVNYNYAPDKSVGISRIGYTSGLSKGAKLYTEGTAINIVLEHDWTTSHFITVTNCNINIDLNGHTWTITGDEVLRSYQHNVTISGGTMVFKDTEWGPIAVEHANLTVRDVTFRDCHCDEYGLLYISNDSGDPSEISWVTLENVTFDNCCCDGWGSCIVFESTYRGDLTAADRTQFIAKNCWFFNCHSWNGGGVLYSGLKQCDITFENCLFQNDYSDKYCGGVIYANGDYNTYKFRNCEVYNCYAYDAGGFVFVGGQHNDFIGDPDFNSGDKYNMDTRTTVCGCHSTGSGGAIYISNTAGYGHYCKINGFNFVQNTAGSSKHTIKSIQSVDANEWGGALCLRGQYAEIERCDFIENYAHYYGGAVYLGDNYSSVKYCVFRDNWSDPNYKGEDIFNDDSYNTISDNIYYSDRVDTIYMYYSGTNTNNKHYAKKSAGNIAGLSGTGTAADPYRITCSRAMLDLAMNVSTGNTYEGKHFLVTKDLNNVYVPVGESASRPFKGTFDGGGHTLHTYIWSEKSQVGLFGNVVGGTVKNVSADGLISASDTVGGVCGKARDATFIGCTNSVTVWAKNGNNGKDNVGGIAAFASGSCRFENCSNSGMIHGADYYAGGIAGAVSSEENDDESASAVFDTCRNSGYIVANGKTGEHSGGILGGGSVGGQVTFKNCVNTGTVESKSKYSGGIIGTGALSSFFIQSCTNSGRVSAGTSHAGGIIGYTDLQAGNRPNGVKQIHNCANYGEIVAPKEIGGILVSSYEMPTEENVNCFGAAILPDVKNCYGDGTMEFTYNCGAIVAGQGLGNFTNCVTNANRPVTDDHSTTLSGTDVEIKAARQLNIYISQHPSETNGWVYWYVNPTTGRTEPDFLTTELGKYSGIGTKDSPYIIEKTSDLRYLELELAQGKNVNGKYFLLKKDISYTGAPIGDLGNPFGGIFDGGGHTITVTVKGTSRVGLFGELNYATVENLRVTGSVEGSDSYTGGLVGEVLNSTIRNCTNSATVKCVHYAAGIAGCCGDTTFIDCSNNGTVSSVTNTAGICAGVWRTNNLFDRCCNNGPINTAEVAGGGIIGAAWTNFTARNCVNMQNGIIKVGGWCAGGIVGNLINSDYSPRIENCANHASVTVAHEVGGIVHNVNPKTVIRNCFNAGKITANEGWGFAAIVQGTQVEHPECYVMEGIGHVDAKAELLAKNKCGLSLVNKINQIVASHPEKNGEWTSWGLDMASHLASPLGTGGDITSLKGNGTETDPYLISNTSDLGEIPSRLIEGCDTAQTYYLLTNDIPDYVGSPIGTEEYPFIGVFDGNGYTVTIADMNAAENVGLFGCVEGGKITNLSVTGKVTGNIQNVGAVVGKAKNAEIRNCSSTATVTSPDGNGVNNVGGICGNATGSKIMNCYVSAEISGSGMNAGGIAGNIGEATVIRNCVKLETVTGSDCVGGIVGIMDGNSTVENCANYGSVTGTGAVNSKAECHGIGGIAGKATGGKLFVCFVADITDTAKGIPFTQNTRGTFVGEVSGTTCTELHYYKGVIDTSIPAAGNNSGITATARKKADCQAKLCSAANKAIESLDGYTKWVIGGSEINKMAIPGNYTVQRRASESASVFTENTPLVLTICVIITGAGVAAAIIFGRKKNKKDEPKKKDK